MSSNSTNKKTAKSQKVEPIIYCGPSILAIGLAQSTVFSNGLPTTVQDEIKKMPALGQMFVPISQYTEFEKRLSVQGSAEQAFFNAVKQEYAKVVK